MRAGQVEQVGTPEEVYARPGSTYVARFVGSPQMDILAGEPGQANGQPVYGVGGVAFPVPDWVATAAAGREIDLGIRPEHILLGDEGPSVTVRVVQPLGPMTYVTVAWDGGSLTARLPGISRLEAGQTVSVSLDPEHLLLFRREDGSLIERAGPVA
jgi:ABC-type sugar transport system ATPase subunit